MKISETADWIRENCGELLALRRRIHQNPELGHQEYQTSALIAEQLQACGAELLDGFSTGVAAMIRGGQPGGLLALREDIDALPIQERTGLPFASCKNGVSHACGHDVHTAALLACAKFLCGHTDSLHGSVLLIFQCAEETCDGAVTMLKEGLFREAQPDAVIGFHCDPSLNLGTVGLRRGISNASCDTVTVRVTGKGGHGAHPDLCVDPVVICAYLLTQLQTVVSRENLATQPAVLTFGTIHGGTAPNIIPDEVVMQGTLRTFDETARRRHMRSIERIAWGCCQAMNASCDVLFEKGMPPLVNTPALCDLIRLSARRVLGDGAVREDLPPSLGSDDFSCIQEACGGQGVQFLLGTRSEAIPNSGVGLHVAENIFPDEALLPAAALLSQIAWDYLRK